MDRLNPLDARFIDLEDEDPHASMAIASVAVFEGPPPSYEEFSKAIAGRLPLVPGYRHKLRTVPLRLGPPVWVEDSSFDLSYHIRQIALPPPGGDAELGQLIGRVMSQRLDRAHPLWEYWLIEGLAEGHWALISKVHHCMVDGVSGTDLYRVIFDLSPEQSPPAEDHRRATPEPSGLSLVGQALVDAVSLPLREARSLGRVLARPRRLLSEVRDTLRGIAKLATALPPAPASSLSGAIGQPRRYTWVRASLDDVKMVKDVLGGTVNDVVLAAITAGFRALLLSRGEHPGSHTVPSLVPVSTRAPGEESIYENRVSALVTYLPVQLADPSQRLDAVRAELSALKASKEVTLGESAVAMARYLPFPLVSAATRFVLALPQREIVTVTTNVPGPRQPLYGLGRRLIEITPYVPIASRVRIGISIFSYCDKVTFGVTGDYATTPDLEVLAHGIDEGLRELVKAADKRRHESARGLAATPLSRSGSLPAS